MNVQHASGNNHSTLGYYKYLQCGVITELINFVYAWIFLTGLFHRAIAGSGAVLNQWALVEEPRERAFRLGAALGCKTTNSKELVKFLQTVPVRRLVEAVDTAQTAEVSA